MNQIVFFITLVLSMGSFASSSLQGSWITNCQVFGKHSFISITRFVNKNQSIEFKLFEDKNCLSHSLTVNYKGTFILGKPFGEGFSFDSKPTSVLMIVHLQNVADQFNDPNSVDGCGTKNWKINNPQNVSGKFCRPFQMPTLEHTLYDIYLVKKDELRFGGIPLNWNLSDSALRPIKLSDLYFRPLN